jgi:hypothetical protein
VAMLSDKGFLVGYFIRLNSVDNWVLSV